MTEKRKTKNFISVFMEVFKRIPEKRKQQFWLLLMYMIFSSVVATMAAGAIALFVAAFSAQDQILSSKYLIMAKGFLHMEFLNNPKGIMIFLSFLMVFFVGIKNLLDSILLYFVAQFGAAMEEYFGVMLFKGFLNMPYQWHLNRNSADIILALQWRSYIGHSFFSTALNTMNDILLVSFLIIVILLVNPYVSIIVFAIAGITASLIYRKIHHLQNRTAERSKEYSLSINRQLTKGIHGIKDVKVSGKSSFLIDFENDSYHLARNQGMRSFFAKIPIALLETIGFFVLAAAIIFMLYFTKSPLVEVTTLISLIIVAAWRILPAMGRIMQGFLITRNLLPYIKVVIDYMSDIELNAVYPPDTDASSYLKFDNEIQVKNISFAYKNREKNVLENISFNIKKGQTIGIVGCSGVGKSTLVDIVIGLLDPIKGQILIDGCELDVMKRYAWMRKLSYVPQSPYIFDGSIAENVAFGLRTCEIDRAFVLECCHMAYMQDFLYELPQGIDALIGERGVRLSGGQRQRVAIARALYTRPELMIFDEATSSLDSKSEGAIQETITSLKGMKTLIIVAHRLKTVENCDCLVWLKNGTVQMFDSPKNVLCEYEESLR